MFGKLGDMMGMMGDIKEAQKKMEEAKERLDTITINEKSANNKIEVIVTASKKIKDISIDDSLMGDAEELSDNLINVLNKALSKANEVKDAEMKAAASGMLNMPGMDQFLK